MALNENRNLSKETVVSIRLYLRKCDLLNDSLNNCWVPTFSVQPFPVYYPTQLPFWKSLTILYCLFSLVIMIFYNLTQSYILSPIFAHDAQN